MIKGERNGHLCTAPVYYEMWCDNCKCHLEFYNWQLVDDHEELIMLAKSRDWSVERAGKDWKCYCPKCIGMRKITRDEATDDITDICDAEQALIEFEKDGGYNWEDVKQELGLDKGVVNSG